MTSGVYQIKNTLNGKVYIGSSIDIQQRWHGHKSLLRKNKHDNAKLQNSWNKNGEQAFTFTILHPCLPENMLTYEQFFIDKVNAVKTGYNICPVAGNTLGVFASDATRKKLSISATGRKHSEETRKKMSVSIKRYQRTPQHNENLRLACIGKKMPPKTEDCKRKMSEARKGFIVSAETKEKISKKLLGRKRGKLSMSTRDKMSAAAHRRWNKI